jgi:hypothetical protein
MKTVRIAAAQTVEARQDIEGALRTTRQMSRQAPNAKALRCFVFRMAFFRDISPTKC